MDFEVPEDLSPSSYVDKPGTFHVLCETVNDPAKKDNGDLIDGVQFGLVVLAGTDQSQIKRTCRITVFNPNMSHADGGAFSRKRFARIARAFGLLDKNSGKPIEQCKGKPVRIDWNDTRGKQAVVRLVHGVDRDGNHTKFFEVDGLNIYHVDDKEVAEIPKNQKALEMISKQQPQQPAPAQAPTPTPAPTPAPVQQTASKNDWESALFGG